MTGDSNDQHTTQPRGEKTATLDRFMRFAVEHLADAIYWIDEPGNIVYANRAASAMTGYDLEVLRTMKMYDINVDLNPTNWIAIWGLLKAAGQRTFESQHRHRSGRLLEVEVTANFLCFENKEYSCAFAREIGARKALDQRLRNAEKMEAVGRLAGGVAHDFNNQLAALLGYTDVIARRARDIPAVLELIEPMKDVIAVAADLSSRLLSFSRPAEPEMRPVDLHDELRSVFSILSRSIDKRIKVVAKLDASRHWCLGDASQLQSAFLNLLLNARDAMPKGGTIRVETRNISHGGGRPESGPSDLTPGDYVSVTISDSGVGMSAEALNHIFEPFYTTKDVGAGGGGLGLAVVYGTLARHGGAVSVTSEEGKGSSFQLFLPVSRAPKAIRESRRPSPKSLLQGHVMLIDDESSVREATSLMLQSLGCTTTAFGDGDEAVEYFRDYAESIDLVLLDLMMPGRPPTETLAALLEIDGQVPVVLVSGYSDEGQVAEMLNMGAKALISKPFNMATLAGKITGLLPRRVP